MIDIVLGEKCKFKGSPGDLCAEFINAIKAFDALLTDKVGEEKSHKIIALCGKAAYEKDTEKRLQIVEEIGEVLAEGITGFTEE